MGSLQNADLCIGLNNGIAVTRRGLWIVNFTSGRHNDARRRGLKDIMSSCQAVIRPPNLPPIPSRRLLCSSHKTVCLTSS